MSRRGSTNVTIFESSWSLRRHREESKRIGFEESSNSGNMTAAISTKPKDATANSCVNLSKPWKRGSKTILSKQRSRTKISRRNWKSCVRIIGSWVSCVLFWKRRRSSWRKSLRKSSAKRQNVPYSRRSRSASKPSNCSGSYRENRRNLMKLWRSITKLNRSSIRCCSSSMRFSVSALKSKRKTRCCCRR